VRRDTEHNGPLARRALLGITLTFLVADATFAQNNSMMGKRRMPAPTSQPAGDAARPPLTPREAAEVQLVADQNSTENARLLRASPIAVKKPEPEKIKVHDQVTIIVRESKSAISDAKFESKRDWTHGWELKDWIRLSSYGLAPAELQMGSPKVAFDYKNDVKNDGKLDRTDELTTRIQATVTDVKPNGTLVIEASKNVEIDEDGYEITLTGVCRSDDITPQNTVLSTQIANMKIDVEHKGSVRDATKRGILESLLDFINPF
jgi:flagellar L-ring protein precursor FlgH